MRSMFLAAAAVLVSVSVASAATHPHRRVAGPHATAGQCRDAAGVTVRCGPSAVTDLEGVPLVRNVGCREGAYSARKPQTPCGRPIPTAAAIRSTPVAARP